MRFPSEEKWDRRLLSQAREVAKWSKDPKYKVGCVIVDDDRNQLSSGYNGFARGVNDSPARYQDQETKNLLVIHAEENAVAAAARNGHSLKGGIAYITHEPCCRCANLMIQAGVKRVVAPVRSLNQDNKWQANVRTAEEILKYVGVEYCLLDLTHDSPC